MASKPGAPEFTGPLAEPIKVDDPSDGIAVTHQRLKKLDALFEHYGLSEHSNDKWPLLALLLAADFVPGFRVCQSKAGRPRKTAGGIPTDQLQAVLPAFVRLFRERGLAKDDLSACALIAQCEDVTLASPARTTDRMKRARTLQNKLSAQRRKMALT